MPGGLTPLKISLLWVPAPGKIIIKNNKIIDKCYKRKNLLLQAGFSRLIRGLAYPQWICQLVPITFSIIAKNKTMSIV